MSIEKYNRTHPYLSPLIERFSLTSPQSTKKTFHLTLSIDPEEFSFSVGDSIGVLVQNDPEEVKSLLQHLKKKWDEEMIDPRTQKALSIGDYLLTKVNLTRANPAFLSSLTPHPLEKEEQTTLLQNHTPFELLQHFPPSPSINFTRLMPLLPRFYSIANSPHFFPNEIHLTISYLSYFANGKEKRGVASHFLCEFAKLKTTHLPIYLQPSPSFHLPEDPNKPIIMIGPGTGVAPFRAFLQERVATRAEGRNWLFFGERNRATDFYYGDFFTQLEQEGRLRLDLAFSRDTDEKVYVQHLMLKEKTSLWDWIQEGAYLYVCGDAEKMAKEVDQTLHQIAKEAGGLSEEESRRYLKQMRLDKRYRVDVY